jgi:site-specific recombinase XerD
MGRRPLPAKQQKQIQAFEKKLLELELKKNSIKNYRWQAANFMTFCQRQGQADRIPEFSPERISLYFRELQNMEVSKSYFLQACTTLELLYRHVYKSPAIKLLLLEIQEKIKYHRGHLVAEKSA